MSGVVSQDFPVLTAPSGRVMVMSSRGFSRSVNRQWTAATGKRLLVLLKILVEKLQTLA